MTETLTNANDPVVVTGLGATTPLGGDVPTFWTNLLAGKSGVRQLTEDWAEHKKQERALEERHAR